MMAIFDYTNIDPRANNPVYYDLGLGTSTYIKKDVSTARCVVYENRTSQTDLAETIYVTRSSLPRVETNYVKPTYPVPPTNCVKFIIGVEELMRKTDVQGNIWDIPLRAYSTFILPLSGFVTANELDELAKRLHSAYPTFSDGSFDLMKIARGSISYEG
jgi:DNA-binding XRE family transcriptional regulator